MDSGPTAGADARQLETHGAGLDRSAFEKLCGLLRYVDGDYQDPETFKAIRKELGSLQQPLHYLAIPPVLFETVVEQLEKSGCVHGARVVLEKPFGTDLASARSQWRSASNISIDGGLPHRSLPRETTHQEHVVFPLCECAT